MKIRVFLIAALLPVSVQAHRHQPVYSASVGYSSESTDQRYPAPILPMGNGRLKQERPIATHSMDLAGSSFLPHPSECPRIAFCACAASVEVFGHSVRALWAASAWYRFPRAMPASGMVAVRSHHVFVLRSHMEGSIWMTADYNSGGHRSRLHAQSISGYRIVNPHGGA